MRNLCTYTFYNLKDRFFKFQLEKQTGIPCLPYGGISPLHKIKNYAGKKVLSGDELQKELIQKIKSDAPFMIARFGTVELNFIKAFDFRMQKIYENNLNLLENNAGFFPHNIELGFKFVSLMKEAMLECDLLLTQCIRLEDYYIKHYMPNLSYLSHIRNIEPQSYPEQPWTSALEDKKILIIHPFTETIIKQYQKRELLYPNTNILPKFELYTLKSIQTIAKTKDNRFKNWFEALDYMYNQALHINFDIAIIGCGAYGFPLAAMLRKAGKSTIHIGGVTQSLFGIKCKRFDEAPDYENIRSFYNDNWVYPNNNETPRNAKNVENGCYW